MELKTIKRGKRVRDESKSKAGTGKVFAIDTKLTGDWVCVNDEANRRYVTVRPSQVSPA